MTQSAQTTTFPAPVFAALAPAAYLHAHLSQSSSTTSQKSSSTPSVGAPTRPSNRAPNQPRTPALNTSSLTHAHGSAVVRAGETSVVVGVRAETVDAADVLLNSTSYSSSTTTTDADADAAAGADGTRAGAKRAKDLLDILIVPNVEYATGCNSSHIPGSAPSSLAQSTAFLAKDLLLSLGVVDPEQLEIWASHPLSPDDDDDDENNDAAEEDADMSDSDNNRETTSTKESKEIVAYIVLYIDCTILSLSGPALPHLWLAILAALRTTLLPSAAYDTDLEVIVCDPLRANAKLLRTRGMPIACHFGLFESALHKGLRDRAVEWWVLADPDGFEEGLCPEEVLVVVDCSDADQMYCGQEAEGQQEEEEAERGGVRIRRIQKRGGFVVEQAVMRDIVEMARRQWDQWSAILCDA